VSGLIARLTARHETECSQRSGALAITAPCARAVGRPPGCGAVTGFEPLLLPSVSSRP
jgi:hypothetical protein